MENDKFYNNTFDKAMEQYHEDIIQQLYDEGFLKKVPTQEDIDRLRQEFKEKKRKEERERRKAQLEEFRNLINTDDWGVWEEL